MTLGRDWRFFQDDPTGWAISEKLDGVRAYWSGSALWTRSGNRIEAPDWFTDSLPQIHLDGEIWAGRGGFLAARNAVNHGHWTPAITFQMFDVPQARGTWAQRMANAPTTAHAAPVAFRVCASRQDLVHEFHAVKRLGGEGLVIRHPGISVYERGRTSNLLKVK